MTIKELLSDYYHYKALYDIHKKDNLECSKIELQLRLIIIELRKREIIV